MLLRAMRGEQIEIPQDVPVAVNHAYRGFEGIPSVFESAVRAGATVVWPVSNQHGWRIGRVADTFGHHWEIGKPLGK